MAEMEPEPAATVIAVLDVVVAIIFVGLSGTLEAGESQQAQSGCAREREKLRTHWKLLFGAGDGGDVRPYR